MLIVPSSDRYLEPGGWIEQTEVEIKAHCDDETGNPDSEIEKLVGFSYDMGAAYGTDFRIADRMKEEMEAAGFDQVKEVKYKLPLGPWSADPKYKEIGKFYERFYKTGLQGWLMHILTTRLGVRRCSKNNRHRTSVLMNLVDHRKGQRPSLEDVP